MEKEGEELRKGTQGCGNESTVSWVYKESRGLELGTHGDRGGGKKGNETNKGWADITRGWVNIALISTKNNPKRRPFPLLWRAKSLLL